MNSKRVLLIAEDPLLNNLYRSRFEAAGFHVDAARSGSAALKLASDNQPNAVLLDPITRGPEATEIIHSLRTQASTQTVPIIALPTNRAQFAQAAASAGATTMLARTSNPIACAIDAVESSLDLPLTAALEKGAPFQAEDTWLKQCMQSAPETLNVMRQSLHSAARDPGDGHSLRDFLQHVHNFTEQTGLLGRRTLFHVGAAVEALAHDLVRTPSQCNASTIRTLGQAIDFLTILLSDKNRGGTREPASAQVLVVDDEAGARRIMMAAAEMVGLKTVGADTAETALSALGAEIFDLIFLDVGMPGMNGFELCSRVRSVPQHERTPIVFITGMATFQNRVQSSVSGGNDFVGKPFNVAELSLKALIWVFRGQLGLV